MSILYKSAAPAKSDKPEAPLFAWVLPPVQGWGLLQVRGTIYRLREVHYDESDGTPRMLVRLLRAGAEQEYQLARNTDGHLACDCADAIYRQHETTCKHVTAVTAAYAELDRQSRLAEFLDSDPEAATLKLISADGAMIDALLNAATADDESEVIAGCIDPTPPTAA
jgi:hypothetical protein